MRNKQYRLAGALAMTLCIGSHATAQQQCKNSAEELKELVRISAGGSYTTYTNVPVTLHGTYTIAGQSEDSEQLKMIGQALIRYAQVHGTYPPAALLNAKGQKTVSWRVLILPYLGEQALYNRFDLTKPWNDSANRHLLQEIPSVYRRNGGNCDEGETGFAGVQGSLALFQSASAKLNGGRPLSGVSANEQIGAGPVGSAVHLPWTAPGDIEGDKVLQLGAPQGFAGEGNIFTPLVFLDGSVHVVRNGPGYAAMGTWTQIYTDKACRCAPPRSVDETLTPQWDLGLNGTSTSPNWDETFVSSKPGKYTVTLHAYDNDGNEFTTSTIVTVR